MLFVLMNTGDKYPFTQNIVQTFYCTYSMKKYSYRRGISPLFIIVIVALAILAGVAIPKLMRVSQEQENSGKKAAENETVGVQEDVSLRKGAPAVDSRAACEAACRDQYGGSGSAGFDACIRSCGAGGAAGARVFPETNNIGSSVPGGGEMREAACPTHGPACPSPQIAECKNGEWLCIGPATGVN